MPDKTSCACSGKICSECFLHDFDERARLHFIHYDHEDGIGDVAKCDDKSRTGQVMFLAFYTDYFGVQIDEELVEACYRGRECPFCNTLQLWKCEETPRLIGNRLTFYPAAVNWNAPHW